MINSILNIMKQKKFFIIIVVFSFILAVVLNSQAGKTGKGKVEPKIQADNQEITENKLIASGNVEIAWEDYRIYADYLEFNQETKDLLAKGRVTMASSATVITGGETQV